MKNIFFIVCHPDDESLWIGGLLNLFSKVPFIDVYVICLSGNDNSSPRVNEFKEAIKLSKCKKGLILGKSLRKANNPLPSIKNTVLEGLSKLSLSINDIDLLITHSPFGDEHMNPHHIQASKDLFRWTKSNKIPFGYFTCLPLNNTLLKPILRNNLNLGNYGILNFSKCKFTLSNNLLRLIGFRNWRYPKFYTQWLVDIENKKKMLNCYSSIDIESHERNYASFYSPVESIYIFDKKGFDILNLIRDTFSVPGSKDYFTNWDLIEILNSKIKFLFKYD